MITEEAHQYKPLAMLQRRNCVPDSSVVKNDVPLLRRDSRISPPALVGVGKQEVVLVACTRRHSGARALPPKAERVDSSTLAVTLQRSRCICRQARSPRR
eukprot:scaffold201_cov405-Prasinococcus_capsulatus_cf.AAC.23